MLSSAWKEDKFDHRTADKAYRQVFAEHGIEVEGLSAEDAAAPIRTRHRVCEHLVAALDDWAASRSTDDKAGRAALLDVAQAADADTWRRQVRGAIPRRDIRVLESLVASPDIVRQPPGSLVFLERSLNTGGTRQVRIDLLRRAQQQYPGDFWINMDLGWASLLMGRTGLNDAIGYFRAALAARPENIAATNNLAIALYRAQRLDEAIVFFRRAIELDPSFLRARSNLGLELSDQNKLDEAVD